MILKQKTDSQIRKGWNTRIVRQEMVYIRRQLDKKKFIYAGS